MRRSPGPIQLGLYQDVAFGETEWFARWNKRDRVEGSFGTLKGLAVTNWGHDYHHFFGLVRETRVATFAIIAHNVHIQAAGGLSRTLWRPIRERLLVTGAGLEHATFGL
ncbi:MAG: hypothetical protein ABSA31_02210 [Acidimicrobiales bacterium]